MQTGEVFFTTFSKGYKKFWYVKLKDWAKWESIGTYWVTMGNRRHTLGNHEFIWTQLYKLNYEQPWTFGEYGLRVILRDMWNCCNLSCPVDYVTRDTSFVFYKFSLITATRKWTNFSEKIKTSRILGKTQLNLKKLNILFQIESKVFCG